MLEPLKKKLSPEIILLLLLYYMQVEALDLEDIEFSSQRFQLSEGARTPKYS